MLSNFEKRVFENNENVWIGKYKSLKNILHWHFEYEIISILSGPVVVKIENSEFVAQSGDLLFCSPNELHYIDAGENSMVEIMIFSGDIPKDLASLSLLSPKISDSRIVSAYVQQIKDELNRKEEFYTSKIQLALTSMIIDIFRNEETVIKANEENSFYKNLITRISDNMGEITFEEAARFSGYTPAYFSRMFKRLSNMTFSAYLNYIRIEKAISLIKSKKMSITEISSACGFSTIRNFNRVFKSVTDFSPSSLPRGFTLNTPISNRSFNPTNASSELV
jgi:xylan 1,4-beta-xylosidase